MAKRTQTHAREVVRISVPLPAADWMKLCTLSALRQQDRGVVAAGILTRGLRGVIARDGTEPEPDLTSQ